MADTGVRFYDARGNLLTDSALTVVTSAGISQRMTGSADGIYYINASAGEKVLLRLASPELEYQTIHAVVPEMPGLWDLTVTPQGSPPNDSCIDAAPAVLPGLTAGTTIGATVSPAGSAFCDTTQGTGGDVWYTVNGNGNLITASTCFNDGGGSSDYDTKISVFCRGCYFTTCVAGNDDSPNCGFPDFQSTVTWCAQQGIEYLILVHGFGTATGNFEMELVEGNACTPDVVCMFECFCGNGIVNSLPVCDEECDDGNTADGDGCSSTCQIEPFGACCSCSCAFIPPDGSTSTDCDITTASQCAASGGTYFGDDTECSVEGDTVSFIDPAGLNVPDGGPGATPGPVASDTIDVLDSINIADINVDVVISHSWIGDLIFSVESPGGTAIDLWVQNCNGGQYQGVDTQFDDEGTAQLCNPAGPTPDPGDGNGNIIPLGGTPMSVFNNSDAQGTWTLSINDNFGNDTGSLDQWSLHIVPGISNCPGDICPPVGSSTGGE